MESGQKKQKLILIIASVGLVVIFGYGIYAVMGKVASAQERYIAKYKELILLEKEQEQAADIKKELAKTEDTIEEVMQSLPEQTTQDQIFDSQLKLTEDIENVAKSIGLEYSVKIVGSLTREGIAEEKARIARSRRGGESTTEVEEKFPSIIFSIELEGQYGEIVKFHERLRSLPYYMSTNRFDISARKAAGEEGVVLGVESTMQVTVFTR